MSLILYSTLRQYCKSHVKHDTITELCISSPNFQPNTIRPSCVLKQFTFPSRTNILQKIKQILKRILSRKYGSNFNFFFIIYYYIQFDYSQYTILQSSSNSSQVAYLLKHIGKKDDNVSEATRNALRL